MLCRNRLNYPTVLYGSCQHHFLIDEDFVGQRWQAVGSRPHSQCMKELRSSSAFLIPNTVLLPAKANKAAYLWSAVCRRTGKHNRMILRAEKWNSFRLPRNRKFQVWLMHRDFHEWLPKLQFFLLTLLSIKKLSVMNVSHTPSDRSVLQVFWNLYIKCIVLCKHTKSHPEILDSETHAGNVCTHNL